MTPKELFELCDEKFEDWIVADQEGEVVIYTGMKYKGDQIVKRHEIGSKIYGGRQNNKNVTSATHRVKVPNMKADKETIPSE